MFNFPDLPILGEIYAPPGGPAWQWDGAGWNSLIQMPEPPLPAEVLGAQAGVGYSDNIYYDGAYTILNATGIQSIEINRLYYTPYRIRNKQIFNKIGFNVSAPYGATHARLGIFAALVGTQMEYPGKLLHDAGEIDVTSSGVKEVSIQDIFASGGMELEPGEYWLAIVFNGDCEVYGNVAAQGMYKFGSSMGPGQPYDLLFSEEHTYAELPPTAGLITRAIGVFPNMSLRMEVG